MTGEEERVYEAVPVVVGGLVVVCGRHGTSDEALLVRVKTVAPADAILGEVRAWVATNVLLGMA
jgi:hypothetical protein